MSTTETKTDVQTRDEQQTKRPWLWNVVLLNDEAHTFEYVIKMCQELFAHPAERGQKIALRVDKDGRAVLMTTHKEHAELKVEQVHGYGRDQIIAGCAGAMSAIIEPAEFGDGDAAGDGADGAERADGAGSGPSPA
jgi:ATP-dependent Clp protease adaptor protein ClpS